MTSSEIRRQFLEFFRARQHAIVPSAPIVIKNDPTLMFTNAGMNQFKDIFLGNKPAVDKRIADTQKCLRVSGKHNDLEEVGVDTYHHTMFEMLGNWSFGDYFKKEAIQWSWELLTDVYKLDKDRLYVTIFEGDQKEGLPRDEEAYNEWKKYIAPERILEGNKKDNFWEMGDTGPCGPCTEIHVDCRPDDERKQKDGKELVNNDHPQVIEIWNNVFMQFNRLKDGSLQLLPAQHVDTGMGFERLVRVIQGKQSNYDTDIFTGTIAEISRITNKAYDFGDSRQAIAFRVIADHIRAISFTIADGQLPSSTGAGYVIRRILRRAVRYYYSYLDHKQPLLFQLVPVLAQQFADVFPELQQQKEFVSRVLREEEEAFLRTLEKGLRRMDDIIREHTSAGNKAIPGNSAFELYDTYGFPADLTRLIAGENGLTIDEPGFEAEMKKQKDRSRAATAVDTEDWVELIPGNKNRFVGYSQLVADTKVTRYRKIKAKGKEQYQLVLAETPFYAESGGQVGDTGTLAFGEEVVKVTDTKKENDLIIQFTDTLPADINLPVIAKVNERVRSATCNNHTATHLLHAALRRILGTHVTQKGSLVSGDVLRFDFAHFSKTTDEELRQVELLINEKIREDISVDIREVKKEEATAAGAMALFGEKYGDVVRMVTIDPAWSVELCGGTHVRSTGMIGLLVITAESAVAAGVRRIEALTGAAAIEYVTGRLQQVKAINELLKTKEPLRAVEKLLDDKAQLEKRLEKADARQIHHLAAQLAAEAEKVKGYSFIGKQVEVESADWLRKLLTEIKSLQPEHFAVLTAVINGKPFVAVGMSEAVLAAIGRDAGQIIRDQVSPIIGGGGGGQKTLATAGGQDAAKLGDVIPAIRKLL